MYDIKSIPDYNQFNFWFLRESSTTWKVIKKDTNEEISILDETAVPDSLKVEFDTFKLRPEYSVGQKTPLSSKVEQKVDFYEKLIIGSLLMRARREHIDYATNKTDSPLSIDHDVDVHIEKYSSSIKWLRTTDFYTAPASTMYHESFEGGLSSHTLHVYDNILDLLALDKFKKVPLDSAVLCALSHDWCKIGLYEAYERNVKNDATGKWEKQIAFKHNQTGVPLGHGVSSMFLLSKFVRLTVDESLAIRWHMGAWRVVDSEMSELQLANEKCPLVHLLQFADQLSIVKY